MFTRIDHMMICVSDLAGAQRAYGDGLGFHIYPGGDHPGRGTHNAIAFLDVDYLELLGVRDRSELERDPRSGLLDFLARGDGLRYFILATDDIDAEVAAMRGRGVDVRGVREGSRRTPEGLELRWRFADLGEKNRLPLFLIQHLTPDAQRQAQVPQRAPHPNGALGIERVVVAVADLEAASQQYARVLGIEPAPPFQGRVVGATIVGFPIGSSLLALAAPAGPGAAQESLDRRGPGPFMAVFRTESLQATERLMLSRHIPIANLTRRHDGAMVLLTRPEPAHGVWLGWTAGA